MLFSKHSCLSSRPHAIFVFAILAASVSLLAVSSRNAHADDYDQIQKDLEQQRQQTLTLVSELDPRKILEHPWMKKYVRVMQQISEDPAVQRDAHVLWNHPRRNEYFFWEFGWVIFMLGLKLWRTLKAKTVLRAIFVQLWTLPLFVFGLVFLIPRLVFGPAYSDFIQALVEAIQRV